MTDTEKLDELVKNSGLKYKFIAEKMGITYAGLRKKIDNDSLFNTEEVDIFCDLLHITNLNQKELIFFANKSDLKSRRKENYEDCD